MTGNPLDRSGTSGDSGRSTFRQEEIDAILTEAGIDAFVSGGDGAPGGGSAASEVPPGPSPDEAQSVSRTDMGVLWEVAAEAEQTTAQEHAPPPHVKPYQPEELDPAVAPSIDPRRVTMLNDVKLRVKIQLGRTRMRVEDVLKMGDGSVVELDKLAGDPVDVLINDRLIARGEVLVLNDSFCVRISEVLSHDPHRIIE